MQGLSKDIQLVLDTIIKGLEHNFTPSDIENPEKLQIIMKSKVSSFDSAKDIVMKWVSSPNAPHMDTLTNYVSQIIDAGDSALVNLRLALVEEIDYSELDAEKHNQAINSKAFILNAVMELDKSLIDLRKKLEEGNIDLSDKEFDDSYPEWYGKGKFFPKSDYWKHWYNKRQDAINICPHSSKGGEIIVLEDLRIQLPKPPKDKSKILFSDLPTKDQYWRRTEVPKGISPDNVEMWEEYIMEEFRRRREGIWFMNNGKPVYLTGNHYFALQWCKMLDDGAFMNFRYAQQKMFYHLEACIVDKRCLGQLFLKSRRTGFTYTVLAILMNMSTGTANAKYGMTSKSGDDVQEAWDKFSYMFLNLPFFFRPVVKGKEDSPNELLFAKPSNNSKEAKKARKTGVEDYLNTNVDHRPTKNDSYDSVKLDAYLGDECMYPDTKVLTPRGFVKSCDLKTGDFILNSKGKKTRINAITRGKTSLYKVLQPYGKDYIVTENHKLYLNFGKSKESSKNVFITPKELTSLNENKTRLYRRLVSDTFKYSKKDLCIDPYIFGLWLGDGTSNDSKFVIEPNKDTEIYKSLEDYSIEEGLQLKQSEFSDNWIKVRLNDPEARGANQTGSKHKFLNKLRVLNVKNNKHIPIKYLKSSITQRLELLAGIIDTDGYKASSNRFIINMSRKSLINDIYTLSKELGLDTSEVLQSKSNYNTNVYTINITDYKAIIPCRVDRKKPKKTPVKNRRGKIRVEYYKYGEYVGINVDGQKDEDKLLVLEDYTITKNCFKWVKPNDYIVHLGMIAPTMMPAGRVVGKAFIGSTMGAMAKGGDQGVELIKGSKVAERNEKTGKTATGLYFYFLAAQENMEEYTDKYGKCWTTTPPKGTRNVLGDLIEMGSIEYLLAVEDQKKKQSDKALNEQFRTYPRTVEHALRDESNECIFNLTKLHDQIEHNKTIPEEDRFVVGNFEWEDGIKDTDVTFFPSDKGRFKISWMPSVVDGTEGLANRVGQIADAYYPLNKECVRFGCDPFSLKSTHGEGSKGSLHGKTLMMPEGGAPSNKFVVEYIARPSDENIFFEDVIKCIRYYGSPIFVESNRIDLLRYMRNRGYRRFVMNRLDRPWDKLNPNEKEYGGQPMSGKDILDSHMNAIGAWIEKYVGESTNQEIRKEGEMGEMPFQDTLKDWLRFNPDDRTKFDATISSGLAIMACQTEKYKGKKRKKDLNKIKGLFQKYNNNGQISSIRRQR